MASLRGHSKWFTPGIGVKRWVLLMLVGIVFIVVGILYGVLRAIAFRQGELQFTVGAVRWLPLAVGLLLGTAFVIFSMFKISSRIVAPYRAHQRGAIVDVVYAHSKRHKGTKIVAIGGGTGLPSVLRGMKAHTSTITAVVTVADDGGSSGRLRRDMNVLPPGDLRNNIAALADDESLMTQLFQYRFRDGDLGGHAFGNLFISALSGVTGSLETALVETARVLNIQGRVLPATMDDLTLVASVELPGTKRVVTVRGESDITKSGGRVQHVEIDPPDAAAYSGSAQAILEADVVVIGPGSLYTSILPNLLVHGIADALRATGAFKIYVCNVAQQPGETTGYTVAEHILALEDHIGRGIFQAVLANARYIASDGTHQTMYVETAPPNHPVLQRYIVQYADLVDEDRPWRHDPTKLTSAILALIEGEKNRTTSPAPTALGLNG
jgi:uncharacterized cofD-like protein